MKTKNLVVFLAIVIASPNFATKLFATDKPVKNYRWASASGGNSFFALSPPLLNFGIGYSYVYKGRFLFSGKMWMSRRTNMPAMVFSSQVDADGFFILERVLVGSANIALLTGIYEPIGKHTTLVLSSGMSKGWLTYRERAYSIFYDSYGYTGMLINAGIMFSGNTAGLGVNLYANLHSNKELGVEVNLHIGQVKSKRTRATERQKIKADWMKK